MSNSSLVNYKILSPNHSGRRTHTIDRITPHCVVGQLTAKSIAGCFPKGRNASCNYGIGTNGDIALIVDEENRSWCSSSSANDQRAVTIECASDMKEPYTMNDTVYSTLIELCTDICKRNGKNKLIWIPDKNKALAYVPKSNEIIITVHRWFANKSCPGDWLYNRLGDLAETVNEKLNGGTTKPSNPSSTSFKVKVLIDNLNYRSEPSMNGVVKGHTGKGIFTILEVKNGWGRLKSGVGWIYLQNPKYCVKICH